MISEACAWLVFDRARNKHDCDKAMSGGGFLSGTLHGQIKLLQRTRATIFFEVNACGLDSTEQIFLTLFQVE